MSWPGEQDQTPQPEQGKQSGRPGGGGRRRRRDSPPEDPYLAQQNPAGTGRRGSGEFARPAEYVQYAQEQGAAYDQNAGYGTGEYDRPAEYPGTGYSEPGYGQPGYASQGYADTGYAEPSYFRPEADPYGAAGVPPSAPPPQNPSFQDYPAGYSQSGYPQPNLNSSGFYPIAQAAQPPVQAPMQPSGYTPVPQPAPEPLAEPEPPRQPYAEPSRFVTRPTDDEAGRSAATSPDPADSDVSDWLHFVESRADQRAERSRKIRVRLIALSVVLALFAVGAGLWYFLTGDDTVKATQTTVLFQIRDLQGNSVGNVVLVAAKDEVGGKADPTAKGAALLIPSELTVEGTGLDSQPFGGAMPAVPPVGKDAVTSLIGVDIDGVWSMDALTFASLIDNLIGVTVDVDVPIPGPDAKILLQPGKAQQLSGAKAYLFATYHAKDEPAAKQLARFGAVLSAMLGKIPSSQVTTTAILNNLGTVPDPALPNDRLASILTALGAEQQGKRFDVDALPIRTDGSGLLDVTAASPVVAKLLAGATHVKDNGGLTRVAVADGTGRADTISSRAMATSKLLNGGYSALDTGAQQTTPTTYVEVSKSDAMTLGKQIAVTLGLPDTAVKVTPFDTTLVEARIVLGRDWTALAQVPADQAPEPTAGPSSSAAAPAGTPAAPTKSGTKPKQPTASKTR